MAKKKLPVPKRPAKTKSDSAPARSAGRKASTPPKRIRSITSAPGKVDKQGAIRERLRLHPLAMANEIVAMLAFDGLKVSAKEVDQVRSESGAADAALQRSPRSAAAPGRPKKKK